MLTMLLSGSTASELANRRMGSVRAAYFDYVMSGGEAGKEQHASKKDSQMLDISMLLRLTRSTGGIDWRKR